MPDHTAHIPQVEEYYDGLYVLNGAVMDKDSYEKHTAAASATSPEADTSAPAASPEVDTASPEAHDAAASDPFSAPQDFRQEVSITAGGFQKAAVNSLCFGLYQVEHGIYFTLCGEHFTMVSNTLF